MTRAQLLDKYGSGGCKIDSECTIAPEFNLCAGRCGVALPVFTVGSWTSNLDSSAQQSCSACPKPLPLPCPAQFARCVMNRCVLGGPPQ